MIRPEARIGTVIACGPPDRSNGVAIAEDTDEPISIEPRDIDQRTLIVFIVSTLLLVIFNYYALPARIAGTGLQGDILSLLGEGYEPYVDLIPYQFWGVTSVVFRVLLPLAVIVWVLRDRPGDYGYRLRGQWSGIRPYAIAFGLMIPVIFLASGLSEFQGKYPLYPLAIQGGFHFWGYQLFYGLQFLGVEAFFRGFMLFGLFKRLGYIAIPVMVIPYTMVHFGKPAPETFAAIAAGFVLGYLAIKSRSFLWGWMLHWSVAITMDIMVIGREFGFGEILPTLF